jgi:hypothetical protein
MKSEFWRRFFSRRSTSDTPLLSEQVLRAARDQHANDFPNPLRQGCRPCQSRLGAFRNGALPSPVERAHILMCSDCYGEYQTALATHRATIRASQKSAPSLSTSRIAVPAAACAILLIILGIAIYSARTRKESGVYTSASPQASPLPSPTESMPVDDRRKESKAEIQKPGPNSLVAVNRVTIDFENAAVLRRRAPAGGAIIDLASSQQMLLIKLPEGSPRGRYTVTLNDPYGESVRAKTTRSVNGKSVTVHLNLVGLPSGKYSICVTRAEEVPSCLPVTVSEP